MCDYFIHTISYLAASWHLNVWESPPWAWFVRLQPSYTVPTAHGTVAPDLPEHPTPQPGTPETYLHIALMQTFAGLFDWKSKFSRDKSLKVQTVDDKTETHYNARTCSFTFWNRDYFVNICRGCIKLHLLTGNMKLLCALGLPLRTVVLAQGRDDGIVPDERDDPSLFTERWDAPELGCSLVLTAVYIKLNPVALGHHLFWVQPSLR